MSEKEEKQKNTNITLFLSLIQKYKDILPFMGLVISGVMSVIIIYIKEGYKDYFGIPDILDISLTSFLYQIMELICIYFVITIILIISIEISRAVKIKIYNKSKIKQFFILWLVYLKLIVIGFFVAVLLIAIVISSFNGKDIFTFETIKINGDLGILMLLCIGSAAILAWRSIIDLKNNNIETNTAQKNNSIAVNSIQEYNYIIKIRHIFTGVLSLVIFLVFIITSNIFYSFGKSIAENVSSFAVVEIGNEQYAILANVKDNYVCVKISEDGTYKISEKKKVFKIVDIKDKQIHTINCKYQDLFN